MSSLSSVDPVLPITDSLPQIGQAVAAGRSVVLTAPPGAGKTSGVPLELLSQGVGGRILLVQPRRLAARSAAGQLARLANTPLGQRVGYQVRFDRRDSAETELLVVTYGILLRRLQADPFLDGVACVILDEFHERSLEADLCVGMLQRIRQHFRPDLRLIVMSATLAAEPLVEFLPDAVAIDSPGRMYPVQVEYRPPPLGARLTDAAVGLVPEMLAATAGHVLLFLPGVGEIRTALKQLADAGLPADVDCYPLYADLPLAQQDLALAASPRRKVVVATNVAETSITIAGVTGVIDSGQARVMRHDGRVGLPQLVRQPISQAAADQRSGRAGRTAAGLCWRLWDRATHRSRPRFDTPEILRGDLAPARLILADWDESEPMQFPWLDRPAEEAMQQAGELLTLLQLLDDRGQITPLGRQVAGLPVHPRLGKLLVAAAQLGVLDDAALAAALMTERHPWADQGRERRPGQSSDVVDWVQLAKSQWRRYRTPRQDSDGDAPPSQPGAPRGVAAVLRVTRQLTSLVRPAVATASAPPTASGHSAGGDSAGGDSAGAGDRLRQALLAAFPDRVARQRQAGAASGLMVGGKGVSASCWQQSSVGPWILCLKVNAAGSDARVDWFTEIERVWLPDSLITSETVPQYSADSQTIQGRRQERYLDLLIGETPVRLRPDQQSAGLLLQHAQAVWGQPWPPSRPECQAWQSRVRLLRQTLGKDCLPACDAADLQQAALELASRCLALTELESADWIGTLASGYSYEQTRLLETEAPLRLRLPSGNSAEIHYPADGPPLLRVRIQELYGLQKTPRIARGRVTLQLHLLGPNYRTEQITDDLERFWRATYPQVRKDLRGRYPKHHWPDQPQTAAATRNGLKPRG